MKFKCTIIVCTIVMISLFGCNKDENNNDFNPVYDTLFSDVSLESQNDVESFASLISEYNQVGISSLHIFNQSVESLLSINNKISFISQLSIHETSLKNLKGIDSIAEVTIIYITSNDSLEELSIVFDDFRLIDLVISNNQALRNIDGFININTIRDLSIHKNPNLNSLLGLSNLTSIDGFNISDNDTLVSLVGLESIINPYEKDKAKFFIADNDNLKDFCALNSIISDERFDIEISNNKYNPSEEDFSLGNCRID